MLRYRTEAWKPADSLVWGRLLAWQQSGTLADFVEKLDPADPRRYLTADGPSLFDTRQETVKVKGEADRQITLRTSQHGVVVSGTVLAAGIAAGPGEVLALAWTGL